jgi:predicted  nucleic acid-binding Zn-ribbon protein
MSEIAEIRARHEAGERGSADADREWLLAEVERLTPECDTALANARWLLGEVVRLTRERDEARDEVERLREERDALRSAAREYLETLGGAMKSGKFEMAGTAEMAHFVRQAMQKLDSLVFDRAGPRPAGLEKLHEPHGRAS